MKPPIPSPQPDLDRIWHLTKRMEWDEAEQCFFICYKSGLKGRLRGEWLVARHNWYCMLGLTVYFPVTFVLLLVTQFIGPRKGLNKVCIFSWGIRDIAEVSGEIRWAKVKGIFNHNGDIVILPKSIFKGGCYLLRESFIDLEENRRFETLVRALWQSDGELWSEFEGDFSKGNF